MYKIVHDVNAYVEEDIRYQMADVMGEDGEVVTPGYAVDTVVVELDESTRRVTVLPAFIPDTDENGKPKEVKTIETNNPIVDRTFEDLKDAIKYYEEMIHQLEQGDVIRNI